MKRRMHVLLLCCMICFMLCMLSSCGRTDPRLEESVVSAEDSVKEGSTDEETKKMADQLLSAFFAGELSAVRGDGAYEWIVPERAQEIREQVKTVGKPFLTEETVLQITEAAAAFYMEAQETRQGIILPAYDTVEGVCLQPSWTYITFEEHKERYNVMLAYTLYLLTPPKYAFSENEVVAADVPAIQPRELALSSVYLALAGEYGTWRDALAALQAGTQGVILNVAGFVPGTQAPNFSFCWSACALLGPDFSYQQLLLTDALDLSDPFLEELLARERLAEELWLFTSGFYTNGYYEETPNGIVHVLLGPDMASGIRELTEQVTRPILTEGDIHALLNYTYDCLSVGDVVLLPDVDGTGDVLTDPIGVDIRGIRLRAAAYLVDLLTPPSYRFADLTSVRGTYYALAGEYGTPEEALDAFAAGELFLLYTEDGDLYYINGSMETEPLMSSPPY